MRAEGGMTDDELWMQRALRLAKRGMGRTSPNPMVGAVLVKAGRVVGEGYHSRAGEAHAEIVAIRNAGAKARGATLYLTLEPCTHHGKTPPCAPSVVAAGVRRVVVGMEDPNPLVQGKGIAHLKRAGIPVTVGVLERECRRLNEAFSKYIVHHLPFVILKVASTLDGKLATRSGESKWITGEGSRRLVHRLRSQVDGVLVGIGTILRDDPMLTARIKGGRDPYRIVLDSRLRMPETAKVIHPSASRTIIVTTETAPREKVKRLEERGVQILITDSKFERVDLKSCLLRLGELGIMSLLVEGGSQINGSFLDGGFVDKVYFFLSPKLIGDPTAPPVFGGQGVRHLREAFFVTDLRIRRIGQDILVEGYVTQPGDQP